MRKKIRITTIIISALLFSTVVGTQFANLGRANPHALIMVEDHGHGEVSPPTGTKPIPVLISSPQNNTAYASNNVTLTFNASMSEYHAEIYYIASWQQSKKTNINLNSPKYNLPQISINITDVPEGPRWLEVYAVKEGRQITRKEYRPPFLIEYYVTYKVTGSSMVNFTIDTTPPKVSILSLENKTYSTSAIPLDFVTNEPISQSTYSLDGQENETVTGNTTLTGLANGEHNLTVYAKDEAGNMGASETIWFSVAEPLPIALVSVASAASIVVVSAILLFHFKKRKS